MAAGEQLWNAVCSAVLRQGFRSKQNGAISDALGQSEQCNHSENTGNSADSAEVRACLKHVRVEKRRVVGVTVRRARPMLASVLLAPFGTRYMRRSAGQLRTVKEGLSARLCAGTAGPLMNVARSRPATVGSGRATNNW